MFRVLLSLLGLLPLTLGKSASLFGETLTSGYFQNLQHPVICEHNGLTFFPGEDMYQERKGCKVEGFKCGLDGTAVLTHRRDCLSTLATTEETTTPTTTPAPTAPNCIYEGVEYRPGQEIYEGKHDNWCFGALCSEEGKLIKWDYLECNASTTAEVKATVSSVFYDLPLEGCIVDGMFYIKGETIKSQKEDLCLEVTCEEDGVKKTNIPNC